MFRIGDVVRVKNSADYHVWPVGTLAKVLSVGMDSCYLKPANIDLPYFDNQTIYFSDLEMWHREEVEREEFCPTPPPSIYADGGVNTVTILNDGNNYVKPEGVRILSTSEMPKCNDQSLYAEFTHWTHCFSPASNSIRDAQDGLIIDKSTVITFLGNMGGVDVFSFSYTDSNNIVIVKGSLNNGYAKFKYH